MLQAELGEEPRHLAYPYGYASAVGCREVGFARDAGYASAVTTRHGVLRAEHAGFLHALAAHFGQRPLPERRPHPHHAVGRDDAARQCRQDGGDDLTIERRFQLSASAVGSSISHLMMPIAGSTQSRPLNRKNRKCTSGPDSDSWATAKIDATSA